MKPRSDIQSSLRVGGERGRAPAVLDSGCRQDALFAEQRHAPSNVVAVQPVVVDRQRVLEVLHRVVPPTCRTGKLTSLAR